MKTRKTITLDMSIMDVLLEMSEGNPGAISVINQIMQKDYAKGFFIILDLDDMNMRGSQIWVGYKDYCGQDIDKFIECCRTRDASMIALVNKQCPDNVAVPYGASSRS